MSDDVEPDPISGPGITFATVLPGDEHPDGPFGHQRTQTWCEALGRECDRSCTATCRWDGRDRIALIHPSPFNSSAAHMLGC